MSQRYQGGILGVGFNPLQAPDAPTIGTATAGSGEVSVAFTAPANVGGKPISSYAMRVTPGGFSGTGSASPITVSGLTNGTAYTFSVAALNSYGPSPYSGTVTATPALFVEDVFSTWLYTGNGSTQTITNGINLSGKGGMVWTKARSAAYPPLVTDTSRGLGYYLSTNETSAQNLVANGVTSASNSGYSLGSNTAWNGSATTFASWTFQEAPNFFDVVTYTGNGTSQNIAHNLGSVPGMIIVKRTDAGVASSFWAVYHRSLSSPSSNFLRLNTADAAANYGGNFISGVSSTNFTVSDSGAINESGATYVAYLYAHVPASDGIIQCGSYTGNGSSTGPVVTLGWEPQWVMIKNTSTNGTDWIMLDNMRGMPVGSVDARLTANTSDAESSGGDFLSPTATGFQLTTTSSAVNTNGSTYIYVVIRRGPMKTPTLGTSVFMPISRTGTGSSTFVSTSGFPSDNYFVKRTDGGGSAAPGFYFDRLRGGSSGGYGMSPTSTAAENSIYQVLGFDAPNNNGVRVGNVNGYYDSSGQPYVDYHFRRAPGFFDTVCYTGTGSATTFNHNLGVAPELMIFKRRNSSGGWLVTSNFTPTTMRYGFLQTTAAVNETSYSFLNILLDAPTATSFTLRNNDDYNTSGGTYVNYLFASCPGVSKVGSYTGTGGLQTINCAFTTGARFVLIKRTDSTGDWFVWDSARGISSGNDPYTLLNTSAAQVTGTNYVDTTAVGFQVTAAAPAGINASGGTYIFLAIA